MDYSPGSRQLQDAHDTRRLADRLAERSRTALSAEDRAYLAARDMMFLATADADGHPTCPRYIHRMALVERSRYVAPDPPEPAWKSASWARDVLPGGGSAQDAESPPDVTG